MVPSLLVEWCSWALSWRYTLHNDCQGPLVQMPRPQGPGCCLDCLDCYYRTADSVAGVGRGGVQFTSRHHNHPVPPSHVKQAHGLSAPWDTAGPTRLQGLGTAVHLGGHSGTAQPCCACLPLPSCTQSARPTICKAVVSHWCGWLQGPPPYTSTAAVVAISNNYTTPAMYLPVMVLPGSAPEKALAGQHHSASCCGGHTILSHSEV